MLLDRLCGRPRRGRALERVHYAKDGEELGRVYERDAELETRHHDSSNGAACGERRSRWCAGESLRSVSRQWAGNPEAGELGRGYSRFGAVRAARRVGRKATGSFYTPHAFVRYLFVREIGAEELQESSSDADPDTAPFWREGVRPGDWQRTFMATRQACRYLGDAL